MQSTDSDSDIKIAGFGFAKRCLKPESLTSMCGTPGCFAPEMLEGTPYDAQVDLWSLDDVMYNLLCGYQPFQPFTEESERDLRRKIRKGDYEFHQGACGSSSPSGLSLTSLNSCTFHQNGGVGYQEMRSI